VAKRKTNVFLKANRAGKREEGKGKNEENIREKKGPGGSLVGRKPCLCFRRHRCGKRGKVGVEGKGRRNFTILE